jgi:cell division protein FtsB
MRIIHYVFVVLVVALLLLSAFLIMPLYFEYRQVKLKLVDLDRSLAQQRRQSLELREEIEALRRDREAIERVARERFGFCREGEKIYHFDALEGLGPTPPRSVEAP